MPLPASKRAETGKLSRLYREETQRLHAEAVAHAPVLSTLQRVLETCAEPQVSAWLWSHRASLSVNAPTRLTALRMLARWWDRRGATPFSDPLFDEPDDFWIEARRLLGKEPKIMKLQLTISGDSIADILRQAALLAREGLEAVPGAALEVRAPATPGPADMKRVAEPASAAVTPAAKPDVPPSLDDARNALMALIGKGKPGEEAAAAILKKLGAESLKKLEAPRYKEFILACQLAL